MISGQTSLILCCRKFSLKIHSSVLTHYLVLKIQVVLSALRSLVAWWYNISKILTLLRKRHTHKYIIQKELQMQRQKYTSRRVPQSKEKNPFCITRLHWGHKHFVLTVNFFCGNTRCWLLKFTRRKETSQKSQEVAKSQYVRKEPLSYK